MKRILGVVFLLLGLVFLSGEVFAEYDWSPGKMQDDGTVGKKYRLSEGNFKALNYESLQKTDADGNMEVYQPADKILVINAASQLSTLSGAAAGQSVYQIPGPGVSVLFDLEALANSGVTAGNGVSAFKQTPFVGVSVFLLDATVYSGPAYDVTVGFVPGATGWSNGLVGATIVSVWPYPGVGATAYNIPGHATGVSPQSMKTEYTTNGATGTDSIRTGVSYWEINKPGEWAKFRHVANSEVSAFVVEKKVTN